MQELITFFSNHLALTLAAIVILLLLLVVEFLRAKRSTFSITPAKMTQLINREHGVVIDIRPAEMYRKGHIIDAHALTVKDIQDNPKKMEKFRAKPIIIVCNTGIESQKVAATLLKQGYNAFSLSGGIRAWIQADMPLVKE